MPLQSQCSKAERLFAFRQTIEAQIRFRGAIMCLVAGSFVSISLYTNLQREQNHFIFDSEHKCRLLGYPPVVRPFAWQSDDPRSVYFISLLSFICTCGMFVVCASIGCKRFKRFAYWETVMCSLICMWMLSVPITGSRRFATTFAINRVQMYLPTNHLEPDTSCFFVAPIDELARHDNTKIALLLDVILTVTCMYLPLRSICRFCICFSAIMCPVVVYGLVGVSMEEIHMSGHIWVTLCLLAGFSFKGAADKMSHQWQSWVSGWDLDESVATQSATEQIARCLCDVVISLASDLRLCGCSQELKSFLNHAVDGSLFADYLSAPDVPRFNAMINDVSTSELPGCMSVSLLQRGTSPREANLLVVTSKGSHGSYLLGIAFQREGLLPEAGGIASMPSPEAIGALDTSDCLESNRGTSEMLTVRNMESVVELGLFEHWLLERESIKVNYTDILGEGAYGIIYGGSYCGSQIAVKCQQGVDNYNQNPRHSLSLTSSLINEIRILRRLRHPNIVIFHGACIDSKDRISLILERVLGQSLWVFAGRRQLPDRYQSKILCDIASALWYLHALSPCVVHGDLKPNNVMIEIQVQGVGGKPAPHVKLIDFGLSRVLSCHVKPLGGSRDWQAPEVYMCGTTPKSSVDIFSFGCVMFFTITGHKPFHELLRMLDVGCLPPLPWPASSWRPKELEQICQQCVCLDAAGRPSIEEVSTRIQDIKLPDRHCRKQTMSI